MSIHKIKKILKTKEKVAKLKADKLLNDINNKKNNIDTIDGYRMAYLSTGRKIKDISGYELANIESFTGNMANVSVIEREDKARMNLIYEEKVREWKICANKTKICEEMIYNIGMDNAYIIQEELTDKINWLNILKKMEIENG